MRILSIITILILISWESFSQDRLLTKDSATIFCQIQNYTPQLLKFRHKESGMLDSIETEELISLHFKDTLTLVVYPASQKRGINLITQDEFKLDLLTKQFAKLLHSKIILFNSDFVAGRNELTAASKNKLLPLISILKLQKGQSLEITVHSDSVGKAINNQILTEKKAQYLRNFFVTNGIKPAQIKAFGKGESEPIYNKKNYLLNRRVELRIVDIDKIKVFYSEKYIPPVIIAKTSKKEDSNGGISQQNINEASKIKKGSSVTSKSKHRKSSKVISSSKDTLSPYLDINLFANGNYMLGSSQWQSPSDGYGHLMGWGSSILGEYYINPQIAIGLKIGYNNWKTTLNFKETTDGIVYKQYINEVSQIPIASTFRFKIGKHIYLMPEGGISFTTINNNELGILDNFRKTQISYGLNVGYTAPIKNWLSYDISGFYYNFSSKELDPMRYAGIRIGLKVSIKK